MKKKQPKAVKKKKTAPNGFEAEEDIEEKGEIKDLTHEAEEEEKEESEFEEDEDESQQSTEEDEF
ncbi:hypothetical protein M1316_02885 [Candidatus Parvarchaeota archaeon]|jgi:hypothetical protein|nr:hypothetical protein [Candidatus Parvarchaeota archaeon]